LSTKLGVRARIASAVIAAALLSVAAGGISLAQRTNATRVRFQPGRTTAVLRGSVSGKVSREYLLTAREGQHMSVHLSGQSGAVFDITSPDHTGLSELQIRDWDGELPLSGTYRIHVEGETENVPARSFMLEITIR
jgi:hypothetical protein